MRVGRTFATAQREFRRQEPAQSAGHRQRLQSVTRADEADVAGGQNFVALEHPFGAHAGAPSGPPSGATKVTTKKMYIYIYISLSLSLSLSLFQNHIFSTRYTLWYSAGVLGVHRSTQVVVKCDNTCLLAVVSVEFPPRI